MKGWIVFPILMLCGAGVQADFYRWVDNDGKVNYSDQPPPPNIKRADKIKSTGGKPTDAPLPYALAQAVANFPVTLFTTECGETCTSGRELLAKRGIPYTEMDATVWAAQEELKKLTGGPLEVPVLKVGRDALIGFEEEKWNTSLDAAGYPRTAIIPPRPPMKPEKAAEPAGEQPADEQPATVPAPPPPAAGKATQ